LSTPREYDGETAPLNSGNLEDFSFAECPEGESALSGGGVTTSNGHLTGSSPNEGGTGWIAQAAVNNKGVPETGSVTAIVLCTKTGHAVATGAAARTARRVENLRAAKALVIRRTRELQAAKG